LFGPSIFCRRRQHGQGLRYTGSLRAVLLALSREVLCLHTSRVQYSQIQGDLSPPKHSIIPRRKERHWTSARRAKRRGCSTESFCGSYFARNIFSSSFSIRERPLRFMSHHPIPQAEQNPYTTMTLTMDIPSPCQNHTQPLSTSQRCHHFFQAH
jgi:hypothetical protein